MKYDIYYISLYFEIWTKVNIIATDLVSIVNKKMLLKTLIKAKQEIWVLQTHFHTRFVDKFVEIPVCSLLEYIQCKAEDTIMTGDI